MTQAVLPLGHWRCLVGQSSGLYKEGLWGKAEGLQPCFAIDKGGLLDLVYLRSSARAL
jgi:hypothetical protein